MAKLGIDLSKFRKVAHDKQSATLRHKDGHEFKVALGALHPSSRSDLARMPLHKDEESKKLPPKYADGGDVAQEVPQTAPVESDSEEDDSDAAQGQAPAQAEVPLPQAPASPDQGIPNPAVASEAPASTDAQAEGQEEADEAKEASQPEQKPQEELQGIAGQRMKAAEAESSAIQGQRQAEAKHFEKASDKQGEIVNSATQALNESNKETQDLIRDIQQTKIDPNHFMNDKSFWGKARTAIGMIIAGAGSGNGPNPVLEQLNRNIDRDIEAQHANLNNKFSLLGAYTQKFKNKLEANAQAQIAIRGKLATDLGDAAATAGTPMAKANLLKNKAEIEMSMLPYKMTMAASRVMQDSGPDNSPEKTNALTGFINQTRMVNPELAKDMESKRVGNEFASHPLSDDTRNQLFARTNMVEAANKLSQWVSKHRNAKGELDPRVRAEGEALAQELQNQYTKGVGASTSKEEQDTIQKHIIDSDPLKILGGWNVQPKLKGLISAQESSLNLLRQQHGLKPMSERANVQEAPAATAPKQVPLRPGYERYVHNGIPGQRPIQKK